MAAKSDATPLPSSTHYDNNKITSSGGRVTESPSEALGEASEPQSLVSAEHIDSTTFTPNEISTPTASKQNSNYVTTPSLEQSAETAISGDTDDKNNPEAQPTISVSSSTNKVTLEVDLLPLSTEAGVMVEGKTESISKDAEPVEAPKVVRLDVLFSFGLVTVQIDPEIDSYMNAVEQVVLKAIADDANLASKITYDPSFKPFVKDTYWDSQFKSKSGRPDVKRMVVTASVPVFMRNEKGKQSVSKTREGVVEVLSAAIQTGSFLAIARGKQKI